MSTIRVDKHVPPPDPERTRQSRYPFKHMAVGESFFIRNPDQTRLATIQQSATRYGQRHGQRYSARKVTEGNQKGVRCWRIQ